MVHDPITEEIRDIRHSLAAQFGNDIYRIGEDARRTQQITYPNRLTQKSGQGRTPRIIAPATNEHPISQVATP